MCLNCISLSRFLFFIQLAASVFDILRSSCGTSKQYHPQQQCNKVSRHNLIVRYPFNRIKAKKILYRKSGFFAFWKAFFYLCYSPLSLVFSLSLPLSFAQSISLFLFQFHGVRIRFTNITEFTTLKLQFSDEIHFTIFIGFK